MNLAFRIFLNITILLFLNSYYKQSFSYSKYYFLLAEGCYSLQFRNPIVIFMKIHLRLFIDDDDARKADDRVLDTWELFGSRPTHLSVKDP